jgi:hypothetical protein
MFAREVRGFREAVRDKWDDQPENGERLQLHDILLRVSHVEQILFRVHDVAIGRLAVLCIQDVVGSKLGPKTGRPNWCFSWSS